MSYVPVLPSEEEALEIAMNFLIERDLLPPEMSFIGFGNTTSSFFDTETNSTLTVINCLHVNFGANIKDSTGALIPVVGPGAEIKVLIGDGGEVVGLNWDWRNIEPYAYYPAITESEALKILREKYGVNPVNETLSIRLGYYAEPGIVNQTWLLPYYIFDGQVIDEGEIIPLKTQKVAATFFYPMVSITTLSDGSEFTAGTSVTFEASVINGMPPYTYIWESDVDGILYQGSSSSFTRTLSVAMREGVVLPHTITVRVIDANGLEDYDRISVTVKSAVGGVEVPTSKLDLLFTLLTTPYALSLVVLAFTMVICVAWRKKRAKKLMGFLLLTTMSLSVFATYLPIVNASPNDNPNSKEVGVEWVNKYSKWTWWPPGWHKWGLDLSHCDDDARGFAAKLQGSPFYWTKKFDWGNKWAWEEDFKYRNAPGGGTDYTWIDNVDFAYFAGHGCPDYILFSYEARNYDYQEFYFSRARWGGNEGGSSTETADLEWIVLDACLTLKESSVVSRWQSAFKGLHGILGFHTTCGDTGQQGPTYGNCLAVYGNTVWNAWKQATISVQTSSVWGAYLYARKSGANPSNDTLYPYSASPDPCPPSLTFVYVKWQC
ncbi:MAG: DUF6345 domain-containing protein [Candidatus Bathyarchaeia archaeon]